MSKFKKGDRVIYTLNDFIIKGRISKVCKLEFEKNGRLYRIVTDDSYDTVNREFRESRRREKFKGKMLFWGCDVSLKMSNTSGW